MDQNSKGKDFEKELVQLLELRGFKVLEDIRSNGFRADLIISKGNEPFRETFLVEAKHHERPIGNAEVLKLGGIVNAYRRTYPEIVGLLVSRSGFTADAKKAAHSIDNVRLATYDQILDSLIDFSSYLQEYVSEYKERKIHNLFVDPTASINIPSSDIVESLTEYLYSWLFDKSANKNLILLGEYGLGKTVFVEHFTYLIAKEIIEGNSKNLPIPIVIYLRYFGDALHDLKHLITSHLVNNLKTDAKYVTFIKLLKRGRILLFLDGFDEMAMAVDSDTRDHNFILLQSLCNDNSHIVFTGRPEYFPTEGHLQELISGERHFNSIVQVLLESTDALPKFQKIYLQPFDNKRILEYLRKYEQHFQIEGFPGARVVYNRINDTYDLKSLASRPVLLDLIVKTLPKLMENMDESKDKISAASLYDLYTRFWLDRETKKGRRLIPNHVKTAFVFELAWKMILTGRFFINYTELPLDIIDFFNPNTDSDWESYDNDIRACSYLHRDEIGNFSFAHKTFMEFFCASRLYSELINGRSNPLAEKKIPSEILSFFIDLINDDILEILNDLVFTYSKNKTFQENIVRFLSKIPFYNALPIYIQCVAYFPSVKAKALNKQLRLRFDRVSSKDRGEVIGQMLALEDRVSNPEVINVINKVKSNLKIYSYIVISFANYLKSGSTRIVLPEKEKMVSQFLDDEITKCIKVWRSIKDYGGLEEVNQLMQSKKIELSNEQEDLFTKRLNATPKLVRELLKKFEITTDGIKKLLSNLKLKSPEKLRADLVLREKDVQFFANQIKLSTTSTAEILSKSRLKRKDILDFFRSLRLRDQSLVYNEIRMSSGLDEKEFRKYLSIVFAAAKEIGLLK